MCGGECVMLKHLYSSLIPFFIRKLLPDKSWDFPDTLARFARWPKFSVAEVEAPFNEINKN